MPRIVPAHCHVCKEKLSDGKCPNGHSKDPNWLEKQQMTCVECYHPTSDTGECLCCGYEN